MRQAALAALAASAASAVVTPIALGMPGTAQAAPSATEVTYVVAVDSDGQPARGFREQSDGDANVLDSACAASPAAVSADIYRCSPSAVGADVCWPAESGSLLCLDDPWSRQLHRVTVDGQLPQVRPEAKPEPFALQLDDGTRCRRRAGGAWGGRDDSYTTAYGCEASAVTVLAGPDGEVVDRSSPLWTVKVGATGVSDVRYSAPETRAVQTAWFAGSPGSTAR